MGDYEYEDNSIGIVDIVLLAAIGYVGVFYWKDILAFLGGGLLLGGGVYPRTGRSCHGNNHSQTIGCGGSNSPSKRYDFENCNFSAYEVTAQIQFGGGCGCGDEATIKHGGPTHQDGNCCWAVSIVRQNGQCSFGGEGPHPDTDMNQVSLGSVGNLQNKTVTIKSIFWTTSSGAHQELYVNGRRMGARNIPQWGNRQKTNRMPSTQQIECRCDCSGARWLYAEVAEIRPPFGGVTYPTALETTQVKAANVGRKAVLTDMIDNEDTEHTKLYEFQKELDYFPDVEVPKPPIAESFLTQRWLGRTTH